MGNQYWWLTASEILDANKYKKNNVAGKVKSNTHSLGTNFSKYFSVSNYGSLVRDRANSIPMKVLPPKTLENNQYFYSLPDNSEFMHISRQTEISTTLKDCETMLRYFEAELEDIKQMIEKYYILLGQANQSSWKSALLLEVIWGYDIDTDNGKYMPFLEVTQISSSSTLIDTKNSDMSSTNKTNKAENLNTSYHTTKGGYTNEQLDSLLKNELLLSTTLPWKPNEESMYEWSNYISIPIDISTIEKYTIKDFSIESLIRCEKASTNNIMINLYRTK